MTADQIGLLLLLQIITLINTLQPLSQAQLSLARLTTGGYTELTAQALALPLREVLLASKLQ